MTTEPPQAYSIVEIPAPSRGGLAPLFRGYRHDTVLLRTVIEGHVGVAHADSRQAPTTARLDVGSFVLLGGDPDAVAVPDLLALGPIPYVTPQTPQWRRLLQETYGERIAPLAFTTFSPRSLEAPYLTALANALTGGYRLRRIDLPLSQRLGSELGNDYFLEAYHSESDFGNRGIGYCALYQGKIVSAATAMAACRGAIDIEVETITGHRGRGLATAVAARLVWHCLHRRIDPKWLASNAASGALALKLGYTRLGTYTTFAIQGED